MAVRNFARNPRSRLRAFVVGRSWYGMRSRLYLVTCVVHFHYLYGCNEQMAGAVDRTILAVLPICKDKRDLSLPKPARVMECTNTRAPEPTERRFHTVKLIFPWNMPSAAWNRLLFRLRMKNVNALKCTAEVVCKHRRNFSERRLWCSDLHRKVSVIDAQD